MRENRRWWASGIGLLARAAYDFAKGLSLCRAPGPSVTVFGSARSGLDPSFYTMAASLGEALGRQGFTVVTGGGPGLMEAVCRGVRAVNGYAVGCRMTFRREQARNMYLDRAVTFKYFFVRKLMLCRDAHAFIALPGGFGTLDELFEVLTLIQTEKRRPVPIVLLGRDYWQPLQAMLRSMAHGGAVSDSDLDFLHVVDDVESAVAHVEAMTSPLVGSADGPRTLRRPVSIG